MKTWLTLIALAGCGLLPGEPEPQWQAESATNSLLDAYRAIFTSFDRDHNGAWDETEFPGSYSLDQNQDGLVTWDEARPPDALLRWQQNNLKQETDQLFSQADRNQDGRLSSDEIAGNGLLHNLELTAADLDSAAFGQLLFDTVHVKMRQASLRRPAPTGKKQIVLLHGVWAPGWYYLYPMVRHLEKQGYSVTGVNFWPTINDIHTFAGLVKAHVDRIKRPGEKISLVAHSMGGLVGRTYIQKLGGVHQVDHLVTFATPHWGSRLAEFLPIGITRQLAPNSTFLKQLNQVTQWPPVHLHCLWTKTDMVVVPARNAVLNTAEVFPPIPMTMHHTIVYAPQAWAYMDHVLGNP